MPKIFSSDSRRTFTRWATPLAVVGVLALGGIALWWQLRPTSSSDNRYFSFTIVDTSLAEPEQERLRTEFALARADVEKNPDDANAWLTMGANKNAAGDHVGAAAIWEYVSTIRPTNSVSFNNLGEVYSTFLNRPQDAVAAYRRAIANSLDEPKNEFYVRSLGDLQDFTLSDPTAALATFEDGLLPAPRSTQLLARSAEVAAKLGNRQKAIGYYTRLLTLDPDNQAVKADLAKLRRP